MRIVRIVAYLTVGAAVLTSAGPAAAGPATAKADAYTFEALPPLPGQTQATALGVNNFGIAVGESAPAALDGNGFAVAWPRHGSIQQLSSDFSKAYAINDDGVIVGFDGDSVATWWKDGVAHYLGIPGGVILAIDAHGLMVGVDSSDAAVYTKTTITHVSLGLPGRDIEDCLTGIKDAQEAVGYGNVDTGGDMPLLMASHLIGPVGTPLPSLGEQSVANGINRHSLIVGTNWTEPRGLPITFEYAVQWIDDQVSRLPWFTDFAAALAVNDEGRIVGYGQVADGTSHAVLWKEGTSIDLNDDLPSSWKNAGWVMSQANGINDHGWIVGEMVGPAGQSQGWLLKPR
jgi:probable HAF family extracellular repeat protein